MEQRCELRRGTTVGDRIVNASAFRSFSVPLFPPSHPDSGIIHTARGDQHYLQTFLTTLPCQPEPSFSPPCLVAVPVPGSCSPRP